MNMPAVLGAIALSFCSLGYGADDQFVSTKIGTILANPEKMDAAHIEVHGKLVIRSEVSFFKDDSGCKSLKVANCALNVRFGDCVVRGHPDPEKQCRKLIDKLIRRQFPTGLITGHNNEFVLENLTVRGVVTTIRKDITYGPSVPKSVRVGFGHLGAFPAEITAHVLEFGKN